MNATIKRALLKRNISLKTCYKRLSTVYDIGVSYSSFLAYYAKKWTCGEGETWKKVISCLNDYGIHYKQGFGWI